MSKLYAGGPITGFLSEMDRLEQFRKENQKKFQTLTKREIQVLVLVAEGKDNPAIAEELGVTRVTVQNHRASIRDKLEIKSSVCYVKYALAYDLINF